MSKMIHILQNRVSGKTVFILFAITMGIYATMLMITIPAVQKQAPHLSLFDMSPAGYSFEYATTLLDGLGAVGRRTYLSQQLPLDFVYPGLFAISYTLLLIWLFGKGFAAESPIFYLAFTPALAGMFDYLENIGIILMLKSYPHLSAATVSFASLNTLLKSICTIGFYLLLLVGVTAFTRKKIAGRSRPDSLHHSE